MKSRLLRVYLSLSSNLLSTLHGKGNEMLIEDVSIRNFSCLQPGLDWTRLFMSLTAGAGTRCMSLLPTSPNLLSHNLISLLYSFVFFLEYLFVEVEFMFQEI